MCSMTASERLSSNGEVNVEIYRVNKNASKDAAPELITMFSATSLGSAIQLISLRVIQDNRSLVAIMRNGDITTASLDDEMPVMEVQGSVDDGFLAASWSPDDSLLALVTGLNKLILMTSTYDVISEAPMETSDFGQDTPINVGWGSKQTQFHGSVGKAAAQASTSNVLIGSSPDEDNAPRISWRGDGAYFVVSSITTSGNLSHRVLRVYDHQAVLQSTSEPVPGLEHPLSWRPSGNLIASTQRFGFEGGGAGRTGRHDLVFFERNGLRHGEFELRPDQGLVPAVKTSALQWGYKVKEALWSSDSNVLALWIERDDASDLVQLWTIGNYHWYEQVKYLKQEIAAPSNSHFTSVEWHPEVVLQLILTTTCSSNYLHPVAQIFLRSYAWETISSQTEILLTPFRTQNVPPPMSSTQLALTIRTQDTSSLGGARKVMNPAKIGTWSGKDTEIRFRQIVLLASAGAVLSTMLVLGSSSESDIIMVAKFDREHFSESKTVVMPSSNGCLRVWEAADGELFKVDTNNHTITSLGRFSDYCFTAQHISSPIDVCVGLTGSGKLQICGQDTSCLSLATNANSFTMMGRLSKMPLINWEKRRVERGSKIVVCIPSAMSLVLQMPRGNLETINPRPLVLEVVRQDLDAGEYRKAFFACRKHRIDLNFLIEHNETAFLEGLSSFVEQVHEVVHLNLFLTTLGFGAHPPSISTISKISDALREELEQKDLKTYVNTILTAHVIKTPPDHESALSLLLRLKGAEPALVEDAVKYVIFLVDANKLFDTALGMYDFSLVLMVAQHSQKDPREYLPFLRELRAIDDKSYQKFKIDDYLKRHTSALKNLAQAGSRYFDEAVQYVERYSLYEVALSIWKGTDRYENTLMNIFFTRTFWWCTGDWLYERREFCQAAAVFVEAKRPQKAMVAYEKALEWQDLFELAVRHSELVSEEDVQAMAYRVSEDLVSKKRFAEAARLILDYTTDVRMAVITLVQGNEFSEALRITTLKRKLELVEDSRAQINEDLGEMKEQLRKQLNRIRELRVKKVEEPDEFYGVEDTALHNVDVMTDVSMAPTAFTRYTVAPSTAASKISKRSSRSKRKMERKVGSGRKGTVDEEEYLLRSVGKLVGRFSSTRGEGARLLPHLLKFTPDHREEGLAMQQELSEFEAELGAAIEEIWTVSIISSAPDDSWAARMEEAERQRRINPVERVAKPQIDGESGVGKDWKMKLFEL
ncbi:IKI3-domain-containing protein [Gymnopus androsaceus JB14]|uniref:Elongator complex protein 1 n=1 Tax=Gymnopus androsaceus JB14 TaxID=1447944 RepID=A0A6A4I7J8_9AGAR|nr:IKI3-domain-containing protein [Gymnopus androsaceus JB14]